MRRDFIFLTTDIHYYLSLFVGLPITWTSSHYKQCNRIIVNKVTHKMWIGIGSWWKVLKFQVLALKSSVSQLHNKMSIWPGTVLSSGLSFQPFLSPLTDFFMWSIICSLIHHATMMPFWPTGVPISINPWMISSALICLVFFFFRCFLLCPSFHAMTRSLYDFFIHSSARESVIKLLLSIWNLK